MSSSATGVGMPICFLGAILLILTQKSSQKFGDVLGIMVKEGETVPVNFSGLFENGVDGTTYIATILLYDGVNYAYLNPRELSTCKFVLGSKTTGIDKLTAGRIVPISIYDINGRRISHTDLNSLPKGIYIVKANGKSYKIKK